MKRESEWIRMCCFECVCSDVLIWIPWNLFSCCELEEGKREHGEEGKVVWGREEGLQPWIKGEEERGPDYALIPLPICSVLPNCFWVKRKNSSLVFISPEVEEEIGNEDIQSCRSMPRWLARMCCSSRGTSSTSDSSGGGRSSGGWDWAEQSCSPCSTRHPCCNRACCYCWGCNRDHSTCSHYKVPRQDEGRNCCNRDPDCLPSLHGLWIQSSLISILYTEVTNKQYTMKFSRWHLWPVGWLVSLNIVLYSCMIVKTSELLVRTFVHLRYKGQQGNLIV